VARTRDEAARRRVLDSARKLVSELGPHAVTLDEIAAAAGVGKQTIYRWWPSKSAVIMDALVADAQGDPGVARDFRDRFFAHRRARGEATIAKGVAGGELRADLDVDDALDILYAPLWLRLLIGHGTTSQVAADRLLGLAWPGLTAERGCPAPKQAQSHSSPLKSSPVSRAAS
jgi:AcrR family transcriptional regulator